MKWDNKLSIIVNKLSIKYQIPVDKIKFIIDDFFKRMKRAIRNPILPTIMVSKLGRWEANPGRIKTRMRKLRKLIANAAEDEDIGWYQNQLERFENIISRIENEKHTRNDKKA